MLDLLCDVQGVRVAAAQAFAETTRTIEGKARAGVSPQQEEILDIWTRAFMYNAFGLVRDPESAEGWCPTEDSVVLDKG